MNTFQVKEVNKLQLVQMLETVHGDLYINQFLKNVKNGELVPVETEEIVVPPYEPIITTVPYYPTVVPY